MMAPRHLKVGRDIAGDPVKSASMVFAIFIGIFALGTIVAAYDVIGREMTRNYMGTRPASATIKLETPLKPDIIEGARRIPGIQDADGRATIPARMRVGGEFFPLLLFVIRDFDDIRLNRLTPVSGAWPPPRRTMLVERTALQVMKSVEGGKVEVKTPRGQVKELSISGVVHDPTLAPAWQEQEGYGYVTTDTLAWLGESGSLDELRILVEPESSLSIQEVEEKAKTVAGWLAARSYAVHEIHIPPPGRHPHQGQMNAVRILFSAFGLLTLILSSILVAYSMNTLMKRQVREIGVMKAMGASSAQVAGLYLVMVSAYSAAAILAAVPLSRHAAAFLVSKIAVLLNLAVATSSASLWVLATQVAAGFLLPLAAAAWPVFRASRISVREAINHHGLSQDYFRRTHFTALLTRLLVFNVPFALSLRNAFRNRARLFLTWGLLATAGALFTSTLNISAAWEKNLEKVNRNRAYDLEIQLARGMDDPSLLGRIRRWPGVDHVEACFKAPAGFSKGTPYEINHSYPDQRHGSFSILALPLPTRMIHVPLLEGHWLGEGLTSADALPEVVLTNVAWAQAPALKVGDAISLSYEGRLSRWSVVGFVEDLGSQATAYVSLNDLKGAEWPNMIRASFTSKDPETLRVRIREIQDLLDRENVPINMNTGISTAMLHNAIAEHMRVLVTTLMAMAALMGIVGFLGLTSTMGMSVLERTRELGVMQAIGATPRTVQRLVGTEGLVVGLLSIGLAFAASLPLSAFMGHLIGSVAFYTPLPLVLSPWAFGMWVALVVVGSIVATAYPAWRVRQLTVREALAYQG